MGICMRFPQMSNESAIRGVALALATSETRFLRRFFVTGRKIFVETWFLALYAPSTGICEETWFLASARRVLMYFKSAVQELNLPGANYEFAA